MNKMEKQQLFDTTTSKRTTNRTTNRTRNQAYLNTTDQIKQEATDILAINKEELTKIDIIDDVSVYAFFDLETLRNYVKLNELTIYKNIDANNTNSLANNTSKSKTYSKRNEYKPKRSRDESITNDDDLYDCSYLKKLDDNLMNEDFSQSDLSDHFEDSFTDDTKSMIWQPTIEKQKKHTNLMQRNISLTSSSIRSYSCADSSTGSLSPDHSLPDCGKAHCKLGCICDAISFHDNSSCSPTPLKQIKNHLNKNDESENSNHYRDHCGRFECMFECNCSRRLRSSTRQLNNTNNKTNNAVGSKKQEDEDSTSVSKTHKQLKRDSKSKKENKKLYNSTNTSSATSNQKTKSKIALKFISTKSSKKSNDNQTVICHSVNNNKTTQQLRQSKRVKLLKKKSMSKDSSSSMHKNSTPSSFKDFYFYYHCDNKLSSLKSRKKKQESEDTNSDLDINFGNHDDHDDDGDVENYADDDEEHNRNDTDFILDKTKRTTKKTKKSEPNLNTNNNNNNNTTNNDIIKSTVFEPFTQNITLKIQSKSSSFVSIPLRIEVFTSKWNTMTNLNKRVLRLMAKLFQKLDVSNINESKKTFREFEFEFDKEIVCVVFAVSSHLKDCSNDDLIKPIGVKITDYDSNKTLISKSRLKSLINEEETKLFSLVCKNEDKSDKSILVNNKDNLMTSKINNENKYVNKSLPRLISRNRLPNHKQKALRPTQTSLIFKNVDCLLEKIKSKQHAIKSSSDDLTLISPVLINYRPKLIDRLQHREHNDFDYLFRDEIDYADKNQLTEYKFYNPFGDESLILDLYKTYESRDFVDSVCITVNDMIKVVSLYSENLVKKEQESIKNQTITSNTTTANATTTVKLAKITTTDNKTNFIIINHKSKQIDESKTDKNDSNLQRKIILPSTSMNFKTLVKIVSSSNKKEDESSNIINNNSNQRIKISSSLIQTTPKTSLPNIIKTTAITKPVQQQSITKILTPIASTSSSSSSNKLITSVNSLTTPKIITMPFNKPSANNIVTQQPKIVSITNTLSKSFIPIRPKTSLITNEPLIKSTNLTSLIMTDLAVGSKEDEYIESRKRKRKQDLSNLTLSSVKSTVVSLKSSSSSSSLLSTEDHLNILNKQINSIKNETVDSNTTVNKKIITTLSSPFKISSSLFKHTQRAVSVESFSDLNESIKSLSDTSSEPAVKKSKILVAKENDSEEEIFDTDNSDSDNECKKSTTSTVNSSTTKKKRKKSTSKYDNETSDSSFDDDDDEYEDEFEKKMTKKLLSSTTNTNSNKPIVNNIHSIRERQRRFRLKKLLIKLKIVLYECESNCKYDLENTDHKLKLDEYFNQKNFKMKSKQNILQEAVLLIKDLQVQEKNLQSLVNMELKRNEELKFHLRELI